MEFISTSLLLCSVLELGCVVPRTAPMPLLKGIWAKKGSEGHLTSVRLRDIAMRLCY